MSKKKGIAKSAKEGLVIDSSVAIAWCFPDEQDAYSQSVLDALASNRLLCPTFGILKSRTLCVVGERRKRSTQAEHGRLAGVPVVSANRRR